MTITGRFARDLGEWFSVNAIDIRKNLCRYFDDKGNDQFTGRWFEVFATMGDPARFTPSDLLAVEALSVRVPPRIGGTVACHRSRPVQKAAGAD